MSFHSSVVDKFGNIVDIDISYVSKLSTEGAGKVVIVYMRPYIQKR